LRAGTSPATPLWVWPVSGTVRYVDALSDATTYYLSVVAVDAEGNESAPTGEIAAATSNTTTPAAPKELSVAAGGPGVVNALTWAPADRNVEPLIGDPVSPLIRDLAGYRVYRSVGGDLPLDDTHRIADLDGVTTVDGDLVRACSHAFYTVTAVDTCGLEGAPAPKAEVVAAPGPAPRPPASLHVTPIGATNVVSWSPATADVEGRPIAPPRYRIERAGPMTWPPEDVNFQTIAIADGTLQAIDATFPPTQPGEKLYYRVRAEDECPTSSAPSPTVQAACPFPGEVRIGPPVDGAIVGGVIPTTVSVISQSGPVSGVTIKYTHTIQGTTRTYTASGNGPWTDLGWRGSPAGDYLITAQVRAANGCIAEKSIRFHGGSGSFSLTVNEPSP
jgi:hypothetical protein